MIKNIAIGLVVYNPNVNLVGRLLDLITSGFSVYVFDNSPDCALVRQFSLNCTVGKINYYTCGKNVGLGFGISTVCAQAYYDSHQSLLFFDQDTVFTDETVGFISEFYEEHAGLVSDYSAIVFKARDELTKDYVQNGENNKFIFRDVLMAINSGSLFYLENLKKLGWHNENFFVDGVDYEFCLNSNNNNYKIGECSLTPGFNHELEQDDSVYHIFGKTYKMRRYALSRVLDSITSNLKLVVLSIKSRNFPFAIEICRLFSGFLFYQILARVFSPSKEEDSV
jgi:rhamnosyltransferase